MQMPLQAQTSVIAVPRQRVELPRWVRWAGRLAFVAAVAVAIALVVYHVLPMLDRIGNWAYAAAFLVQGATAATIIVPIPGLAALITMSLELNPFALAAVGAAGGAMGELTGYWLGAQGRGMLEKTPVLKWVRPQMERRGAFVIGLFAAVPVLPMDAAGMIAGSVRYPVAKFLSAMFVGKFVLLLVTFLGARGVFASLGS